MNFVYTNKENDNSWVVLNEAECIFKREDEGGKVSYLRLNRVDPKSVTWATKVLELRPHDYIFVTFRGKGFFTPSWQKGDLDEMTTNLGPTAGVDLERHKRAWAWLFGEGGCKAQKPVPF